jgi:DNA-binding transcriptional LysR family regulator
MELDWLEDFLALSVTLNFSRAAEARNVTQSAFSRRIRNLEIWVGTSLIDRSVYPVALTPAGTAFRAAAAELVHELAEAREEALGRTPTHGAVISFTALHTLALSFFPAWLRGLEERLGRLKTRMAATNVHDCIEAVTAGACDLMLCYSHPIVPTAVDISRYPSLRLANDRILPVCAPDGAGRPLYDIETTGAALPYLCYTPDSFLGRIVQKVVDREEISARLDFSYENSMSEALKAAALQRQGLAWLPESAIRRELAEGSLVQSGGDRLVMTLDIRLYRAAERSRKEVQRLWEQAALSAL